MYVWYILHLVLCHIYLTLFCICNSLLHINLLFLLLQKLITECLERAVLSVCYIVILCIFINLLSV